MAMRVLHAVESLQEHAGSAAICLRGLFTALRDKGVESQVVTLDATRKGRQVAARSGSGSGPNDDLGRAHLLHIHGWGYDLARKLARVAMRQGRPYLISPYGSLCKPEYDGGGWRKRLRALLGEGKVIRQARTITVLNEVEEHELRNRFGDLNIVRLPTGLGVREYEESATAAHKPRPPDGRCILVLGPIHPAEGFVPLLKAFAELESEGDGWSIMLAGRAVGDWRKMLEAAVRRKGGEDRVLFSGECDGVASQRALLARASLLAAPSLRVRCPVSVMQAVASGVPAFATTYATLPELKGVIRVCGPSRGDIKATLRPLLTLTDEERAALSQRARDVARTALDWSVLVDRYVQLYAGLI